MCFIFAMSKTESTFVFAWIAWNNQIHESCNFGIDVINVYFQFSIKWNFVSWNLFKSDRFRPSFPSSNACVSKHPNDLNFLSTEVFSRYILVEAFCLEWFFQNGLDVRGEKWWFNNTAWIYWIFSNLLKLIFNLLLNIGLKIIWLISVVIRNRAVILSNAVWIHHHLIEDSVWKSNWTFIQLLSCIFKIGCKNEFHSILRLFLSKCLVHIILAIHRNDITFIISIEDFLVQHITAIKHLRAVKKKFNVMFDVWNSLDFAAENDFHRAKGEKVDLD